MIRYFSKVLLSTVLVTFNCAIVQASSQHLNEIINQLPNESPKLLEINQISHQDYEHEKNKHELQKTVIIVPKEKKVVRLLSIDGGGIKGLIPAKILDYLEQTLNKPISDIFHMAAGTSTGALIVTLLSAEKEKKPLSTASQLVDLYKKGGSTIFQKNPLSLGGLVDAQYTTEGLKKVISDKAQDLSFKSCRMDTLITTYDLQQRELMPVSSWQAKEKSDQDFKISDILTAAIAAPLYFPPAIISNLAQPPKKYNLIDACLVANNPATCLLEEAKSRYPDADEILLLSLGTGRSKTPITFNDNTYFGLIRWSYNGIFDLFIDSSAEDKNIQKEYQNGTIQGSYFRFQPDLEAQNLSADDISEKNISILESQADEIIKSDDFKKLVDSLKSNKSSFSPSHK
jgi:patatin-like phospholipase/acyl hydrolase